MLNKENHVANEYYLPRDTKRYQDTKTTKRTTHPGSSKEMVVFFDSRKQSPLEKDRLTAQSATPSV
jgi:hypothetical protein